MSTSATASEWDEVRTAFASSILVDTALSSLAENLDGPAWPGSDKSETPAVYIDHDFDEVTTSLALKGYPDKTMADLITILRETLEFDDPFGDMVEQSAASAAADNPILENLKKLGIPAEFPIEFTSLSADTLEFCERENLATLGEFAVFAQGMSQNVVVGGDFRSLLNSLSHVDEQVIKKFLPYRAGEKGLHFIEAVAAVVLSLSPMARKALGESGANVPEKATARIAKLARYFAADVKALDDRVVQGASLDREVMVIQDTSTESLVAKLIAPHLTETLPEKKSGWFGRLFGR